MPTQVDFHVETFGAATHPSPLGLAESPGQGRAYFVSDADRVRLQWRADPTAPLAGVSLEQAGPRATLFFDPKETTAGVVTCGGLSPGLNNVIRSIYFELTRNYGVHRVLGFRQGYRGLTPNPPLPPLILDAERVAEIHKLGGTILGTSRGPRSLDDMIAGLQQNAVDVLFCIGGDGTQRGANDLSQEINRHGLSTAVIGVPKTIDNDVPYVETSFGYATALEQAEEALRAADVEARSVHNGVGLVKLMGRHAGFIAAGAAMASGDVDFVLTPEIPFPLTGEQGLLPALQDLLSQQHHAVLAVAEGAGQHLFDGDVGRDASGNAKLHDIGVYLREKIKQYFAERDIAVQLKYIDPSYLIRSVPANCTDRILSDRMARAAVHAAMAGKTNMLVGSVNRRLVHVPIPTVVAETRRLRPESDLWSAVQMMTGQPSWSPREAGADETAPTTAA